MKKLKKGYSTQIVFNNAENKAKKIISSCLKVYKRWEHHRTYKSEISDMIIFHLNEEGIKIR